MIKPDIILAWPTHMDFPGFRIQLRKYRHFFNKVIIVWSRHWIFSDIADWFPEWFEENIDEENVEFVSFEEVERQPSLDWGDRIYQAGIKRVSTDFLLFTQQDFIIKNEELLPTVFSSGENLITHHWAPLTSCNIYKRSRCEPDFIFVNVDMYKKTSMDMTACPSEGFDHWGKLSLELYDVVGNYKTLDELGFNTPDDWEHLGGLVVNFSFLRNGQKDSLLGADRFYSYNRQVLEELWDNPDIKVHPSIIKLIEQGAK